MLANRSIPRCTVVPELAYEDVGEAIDWLCDAFDFTLRLRIGNHRAQLKVGDGAVVLTEQRVGEGHVLPGAGEFRPPRQGDLAHSVMVRVQDVDRHHERAKQRGARILRPPADYPYGERQYTAEDLAGHCWTFSQSIADVAPENGAARPARSSNQLRNRESVRRRAKARAAFFCTSEDIGGLDPSGGQLRDEFAIRSQKIVLSEFFRQSPGDLLECAWRRVRFRDCCGKEADFKLLGRSGIVMMYATNLNASH